MSWGLRTENSMQWRDQENYIYQHYFPIHPCSFSFLTPSFSSSSVPPSLPAFMPQVQIGEPLMLCSASSPVVKPSIFKLSPSSSWSSKQVSPVRIHVHVLEIYSWKYMYTGDICSVLYIFIFLVFTNGIILLIFCFAFFFFTECLVSEKCLSCCYF